MLHVSTMAIPTRCANPTQIAVAMRTFFVTSSIAEKRNLLQSERSARLFIQTLYHYRSEYKYLLHDFVVMPDHFHLLVTVGPEITIERAVQFVKGGFAFRAGKKLGFRPPVWQRGFSEVRIYDPQHLNCVHEYIVQNPVKRGLVQSAIDFPFSSVQAEFDLDEPPPGLKPGHILLPIGTSRDVP